MSLPVSSEYLAAALQNGYRTKDLTLVHHQVGELVLPSGQLVACDPFVFAETGPFSMPLPRGRFPVILSVAESPNDQRVAYATLNLKKTVPVAWSMMTVEGQKTAALKEGELFGYPVDAGTGCFADVRASMALAEAMRKREDFCDTMITEMDKTYTDTWSWVDVKFGDCNLIAFSSGYGDGVYASYAGSDSEGEVSVVVTDFGVVPYVWK